MDLSSASAQLEDAQKGFNLLFLDNIDGAKEKLRKGNSAFHSSGLGIICFIQAALGLERELMPEAAELLGKAEHSCKAALNSSKSQINGTTSSRFPAGLEYEILLADAVVFSGLIHALNESYVGMVKAFANSKFSKLFKAAFPNGLPGLAGSGDLQEAPRPNSAKVGLFGRLTNGLSSKPNSRSTTPVTPATPSEPNSIDDFILAGSAFGYGLFSLAMSLLPSRVRSLVSWWGLQTDRQLALQALMFAATKDDVHSVFASIALMLYWDVVLALSGWQAEADEVMTRYTSVLEPLERRYPTGSLWTLYKAKLELMRGDTDAAREKLESVVFSERAFHYKQADALLIFELAWTLFGQRDYLPAADLFVKITVANNWSHATYIYIAAGCYLAAGDANKAADLLRDTDRLLKTTKKGGKELPAETFVRKRLQFYSNKQASNPKLYLNLMDSIAINNAEEIAVFWNIHDRISLEASNSRIREWEGLNPPIVHSGAQVPNGTGNEGDTTTAPLLEDEITLRDYMLGIVHRTAKHFPAARECLNRVLAKEGKTESSWLVPQSAFELAVLELQEADAQQLSDKNDWAKPLLAATALLAIATRHLQSTMDMSTRLEMRIAMLSDEIKLKQAQIAR